MAEQGSSNVVASRIAEGVGRFLSNLGRWVFDSKITQLAVAVVIVHANAAALAVDPNAVLWIGTALILAKGAADWGKNAQATLKVQ